MGVGVGVRAECVYTSSSAVLVYYCIHTNACTVTLNQNVLYTCTLLLYTHVHTILTHTCRYDGKLKEAKRLGAKKGISVGTALSFTFFLIFLVDAVAFWFGGYLISEGLSQGGDIITVSVM